MRGTLTPQAEPTPLERWCAHLDATPTAVQRAVAECFEDGAPLLVTAPTGSGKTAAVMLPVLAALARVRPRATGLVGALYASFHDFPLFTSLSMLYFAAATWSEASRRLGKAEQASSFLLSAEPRFAPGFRAICDEAVRLRANPDDEARRRLVDRIRELVEPFDTAGLLSEGRSNWHPVDYDDLRRSASKVGATPAEVDAMLARHG